MMKWPQLFIEVLSLDSWGRFRTEGYGYKTLLSNPGKFVSQLSHLWPPSCSNGPAFIFMCHTLRFSVISSVILYSFMSSLILSSHLLFGISLIFLCTCIVSILLVVSFLPSLSCSHTIAALILSEECCHWLDVGFSPDVFILDVVLLGLASSPSQHSRLSGVQFFVIFFVCT